MINIIRATRIAVGLDGTWWKIGSDGEPDGRKSWSVSQASPSAPSEPRLVLRALFNVKRVEIVVSSELSGRSRIRMSAVVIADADFSDAVDRPPRAAIRRS